MNISNILKLINEIKEVPKGYCVSPTMLNSIKNTSIYREETANILPTFAGFEIKESVSMPDDMMVAFNCRGQTIGVMKLDEGKMTYTEIKPYDFFSPMFLEDFETPPTKDD